jgi:hypothetical protein
VHFFVFRFTPQINQEVVLFFHDVIVVKIHRRYVIPVVLDAVQIFSQNAGINLNRHGLVCNAMNG